MVGHPARWLAIPVFLLVIAANPLLAQESADRYAQVKSKIANAIEYEIQQKDIPAFSIALVADGKIVYSQGFGYQDPDNNQPATGRSIYRVGSISKLLTDVALMQLVQRDAINIDRPVTDYVPDFAIADPDHTSRVTLRHLSQHRAGIVRESPVGNYFDDSEPSLSETIGSLRETPPVYSVGARTKYSNAGVSVIGQAIEQVSDQSHPEFVRENILAPLGMDQTSFEKQTVDPDLRVTGWMWGYDRPRFQAPDFLLGTGPAGNLYASVEDLAKFCLFVMQQHPESILDSRLLKTMTTAGKDGNGNALPYGIGFRVRDYRGEKRIGHGGAVYGFSTQLEILENQKIAVCAASSKDGTNAMVTRICDYALDCILAIRRDQPLPEYATTTTVDPRRAVLLPGRYQVNGGQERVEIDSINDLVYLWQGSYQREIRSRQSDGNLVLDDVFGFGTPVKLDGDKLTIGGQTYQRMNDEPPAECEASLRDLVGEYGWDHNTLYILERDGQLWALIEWFYYYPLTRVEADRFAFPDYGLYHGEELFFQRSPSGEITGVTAAQVAFPRREVGTREGVTFKIERKLPVEQLRQMANQAEPPAEVGTFRDSELVELKEMEPSIQLDIRYATTNNFMDTVFYQQPRAFAQQPAAEAAVEVHRALGDRDLGLLIFDAYRPWRVTKMFWDATPDDMKDFVANPASGSRHNRGCALDLTLFDRKTGDPIPMVSGYDEFSQRSYPLYPGGTHRQRWYRGLLRRVMQQAGFSVYEFEWWHFDFQGWERYRIGNQTFEQIKP